MSSYTTPCLLFFINIIYFWTFVGSFGIYQYGDDKRLLRERITVDNLLKQAVVTKGIGVGSDNVKMSNNENTYNRGIQTSKNRIETDDGNKSDAGVMTMDDIASTSNLDTTNVIDDNSMSTDPDSKSTRNIAKTNTNTIANTDNTEANVNNNDKINRQRRHIYGSSIGNHARAKNSLTYNANYDDKGINKKNGAGTNLKRTKNTYTDNNADTSYIIGKDNNRNKGNINIKRNQKKNGTKKKESSSNNTITSNNIGTNTNPNFDRIVNDIVDALRNFEDEDDDDEQSKGGFASSSSGNIIDAGINHNNSKFDTNGSINTERSNGNNNYAGSSGSTKYVGNIDTMNVGRNSGYNAASSNDNTNDVYSNDYTNAVSSSDNARIASSSSNTNAVRSDNNIDTGSYTDQSSNNLNDNNEIAHILGDEFMENVTANTVNEMFNNETYFVSQEDLNFFKSLFKEVLFKFRRNLLFREFKRVVRKEVRVMERFEWRRFVKAVNSLKQKGDYDRLAAIHRGFARMDKSHFGPNFPSWHRLYLLVWEHALQKEYPDVSIPYWDCTLDYDIKDPTNSIVWSDIFFGGGKGIVMDGPFANWKTGLGDRLFRKIGSRGSLISKEFMKKVLSKQSHQITMLSNLENRYLNYSLEAYHDSVHRWIGGQMQFLDEACEDPIFLVYHSFVDYFWQLYRIKLKIIWKKSPFLDYPEVNGDHYKDELMDPFGMQNKYGYLDLWYDGFYKYQAAPTCGKYNVDCGSTYLYCDKQKENCLTKTKEHYKMTSDSKTNSTSTPKKLKTRLGRKYKAYFVDRRTLGN